MIQHYVMQPRVPAYPANDIFSPPRVLQYWTARRRRRTAGGAKYYKFCAVVAVQIASLRRNIRRFTEVGSVLATCSASLCDQNSPHSFYLMVKAVILAYCSVRALTIRPMNTQSAKYQMYIQQKSYKQQMKRRHLANERCDQQI